MTITALSPVPIFRAFDSASLPLAGGLLYTYAANTLTPLATYSSSDTSTPNSNPVVLDTTGTAIVRLDPNAAYKFVLKDSLGTTQWTVDYWQANYLTQADIGLLLYPRTSAEIAAGVTPVAYQYSEGVVDRYQTNSVPGTTDMSAGFQAALTVMGSGGVVTMLNAVYLIGTGLTIPGAGIQIVGQGKWKTTVKWSGAAGAVFRMQSTASANSYCRFKDFAITLKQASDIGIDATSLGISVFDNVRIWGDSTGASAWGTGIKISAASASAYDNDFYSLDIQFCTNGVQISSAANEQHFFGGQINSCTAGVLMDGTGASLSDNIRFYGVRLENNVKAADVRDWNNLLFCGCRFEKNAGGTYGVYYAGGSTTLHPLLLIGNSYASYGAGNAIFSNAAVGRLLQFGENPDEYLDVSGTGTRYLGLGKLVVGNPGGAGGGIVQAVDSSGNAALKLSGQGNGPIQTLSALVVGRVVVTYSASMTPNAIAGNEFDITATNGTAFTINAPSNPTDGQRITITIRNAAGGALGAVTWDAVYKLSAWTQPANGFSRSIDYKYNATNWIQVSQTGVDVPN